MSDDAAEKTAEEGDPFCQAIFVEAGRLSVVNDIKSWPINHSDIVQTHKFPMYIYSSSFCFRGNVGWSSGRRIAKDRLDLIRCKVTSY